MLQNPDLTVIRMIGAGGTVAATLLCWTLTAALAAQTPLPVTDELGLGRIQNQVRASLDQLPNHTCRVDIRRAHVAAKLRAKIEKQTEKRRADLREKIAKKTEDRSRGRLVRKSLEEEYRALEEEGFMDIDIPLDVTDSIALEVAVVDNRELYAFPDSPRFESIPLAALIGHGTVATGVFTGHARRILVDDVGTINYVGEERMAGQLAHRYDYAVALGESKYSVANQGLNTRAPYHGSFWAAADTDELLRLTVQVDEFPRDVGVEGFTTQIDYQMLTVGSRELLLPRRSRLKMLLSTGVESVSETRFEDCRSFVGSSTLSFDDNSSRFYVTKTEVIENLKVPPGVLLPVRLTTRIDSKISSIGTRVEAELTDDVRLDEGAVLPKGALLRGRLRRLDFYEGGDSYFAVGIEFQELIFGTRRAVLSLALDQVAYNVMGATKELPAAWSQRETTKRSRSQEVFLGESLKAPDITEDSTDRFVAHDLFGVGVLYVLKPIQRQSGGGSKAEQGYLSRYRRNGIDNFKLVPGLRMTWRTISAATPPSEQR
jgi:hypothetical protein